MTKNSAISFQEGNEKFLGLNRPSAYFLILLVAFLARFLCLAHRPFYCDVPDSILAIRSGAMHLHFPGYVVYHVTLFLLSKLTGNLFDSFLIFTVINGLLSTFYVMRTAEILGGLNAAVMAGLVAGLGALDIYFSSTGASYPADSVAAAAMLYYGFKTIYTRPRQRDIIMAELWCGYGIAMRPLSAMCLLPALFYLIRKNGSRSLYVTAAGVFLAFAGAMFAIYTPYYDSLAGFIATDGAVAGAAGPEGLTLRLMLTNTFRFGGFPAYFFNIWLLFGIVMAYKAFLRGAGAETKQIVKYLAILTIPYLLILLKHFPHAGYLCLLAPVLCIFPLIFPATESIRFKAVAAFVFVSLMETFVFRPVAPTSITRCVADSYFLQYSQAGIQANMFESLALLAWKNGIWVDQIPATRLKQAENIYGTPQGPDTPRLDRLKDVR